MYWIIDTVARSIWRRLRGNVEALQSDCSRQDAQRGYNGTQRLYGGSFDYEGDEASESSAVARRLHARTSLLHCHRIHVTWQFARLFAQG